MKIYCIAAKWFAQTTRFTSKSFVKSVEFFGVIYSGFECLLLLLCSSWQTDVTNFVVLIFVQVT